MHATSSTVCDLINFKAKDQNSLCKLNMKASLHFRMNSVLVEKYSKSVCLRSQCLGYVLPLLFSHIMSVPIFVTLLPPPHCVDGVHSSSSLL